MSRNDFDADTIKRINEIYHDIESDTYMERHPEIYSQEDFAWELLGKKYFKTDKPLTVIDVGTGVGFVPFVIGKYLKAGDKLICTDISEAMLRQAEKQLVVYKHINKQFIKADVMETARTIGQANIITMNSVLHHLPNYEEDLRQLEKLVKDDGLFIIMHECSSRFFKYMPIPMRLYLAGQRSYRWLRQQVKRLLISLKLYRTVVFKKDKITADMEIMYAKIQKAIRVEGLADRDLSLNEINAIIDFHATDEEGEGFDPFVIHKKFFADYEIAELFMTKHLGPWIDEERGIFNRLLNGYLKRFHPNEGAIFGLVMRKKR